MDALRFLVLPILLYITLVDVKSRIVPEKPSYILFLISAAYFVFSVDSLYWAASSLLVQIFFLILYLKGVIADGDYFVMLSLSFLIKDFLKYFQVFFEILVYFSSFYSIKLLKSKNKKIVLLILTFLSILFLPISFQAHFLFLMLSTLILLFSREELEEYRTISPEDLVEGDLLAEDIVLDGKVLFKNPGRSLTKKEIEEIKRLGVREIRIRWGPPFMVAIFLSYLLYLILESKEIFHYLKALVPYLL